MDVRNGIERDMRFGNGLVGSNMNVEYGVWSNVEVGNALGMIWELEMALGLIMKAGRA